MPAKWLKCELVRADHDVENGYGARVATQLQWVVDCAPCQKTFEYGEEALLHLTGPIHHIGMKEAGRLLSGVIREARVRYGLPEMPGLNFPSTEN